MDPLRAKEAKLALDRGTVAVHQAESLASAEAAAHLLRSSGLGVEMEAGFGSSVLIVVPWEQANEAARLLRALDLAVVPFFGTVRLGEPPSVQEEPVGGLAVRALDPSPESPPPLPPLPPPLPWTRAPLVPLRDASVSEAEVVEALRRSDVEDDEETFTEPPTPAPAPLGIRVLYLAVALLLVGLLPAALSAGDGLGTTIRLLAANAELLPSETYRLVTAGFVHFSWGHLFSNLVFGGVLGVVLMGTHFEGAVAAAWLVASCLGIGAEVLTAASATWVGGASAGNYGLVGLWARGQLERSRRAPLPHRLRVATVGLLLILVPGALTPVTDSGARVAVLAHAVGFVVGYFMGFIFPRRLRFEDDGRLAKRARIAGVIVGLVVLGAYLAAGALGEAQP